MSTEPTPSTIAWWVLVASIQRPSCSPSTSVISHSGRERSRRCDQKSPSQSSSSASPPGAGSAARRTWARRSKAGSATQAGRCRPCTRSSESRMPKRGSRPRRSWSSSSSASSDGGPPVSGSGSKISAPPMCIVAPSSCCSSSRKVASSELSRSSVCCISGHYGGPSCRRQRVTPHTRYRELPIEISGEYGRARHLRSTSVGLWTIFTERMHC